MKKINANFSLLKFFLCNIPVLLAYIILVPASSIASVTFTLSIEKIINAALESRLAILVNATAASILLALIDITVSLLRCKTKIKVVENCAHELRCDLIHGMLKSPVSQTSKRNVSDYTSIITNDIDQLRDSFFSSVCNIYESFCSFIISMVTIMFFNPMIGLFLLIIGTISINVPKFFSGKLREIQTAQMDGAKKHLNVLHDIFGGYWIIKKHHLESQFEQHYSGVSAPLASTDYWNSFYPNKVSTISAGFTTIAYIGVISMSVYSVICGQLDMGIILSLSQLIGGILMPIEIIPHCFSRLESAYQVKKEISTFFCQREIEKNHENELKSNWNTIRIEFTDFTYPDAAAPTILKSTLQIERGKKYAIIGRSGSGKSTIARMLAGMHPAVFEVFVDEGRTESTVLSNCVSYMDQNIFLFNDSIYQNVSLFRNLDRNKVRGILNKMQFVKAPAMCTDVLDMLVGESGANLSGGERQRIALARELIIPNEILILDEYTSNLDPKTAKKLDEMILGFENITCLIITHQLDSVLLRNCDGLYSLEDGYLIELSKKENCNSFD